VFSQRSVSDSWVRKIGSPFSSSAVDAGGHGRVLTLTHVFAIIASRWVVTNSYSMDPPDTPQFCYADFRGFARSCGPERLSMRRTAARRTLARGRPRQIRREVDQFMRTID